MRRRFEPALICYPHFHKEGFDKELTEMHDEPEKVDAKTLRGRLKEHEIAIIAVTETELAISVTRSLIVECGAYADVVASPGQYPPESRTPADPGPDLAIMFCDLGAKDSGEDFLKAVFSQNVPVLIITDRIPKTEGLARIAKKRQVWEIVSADLYVDDVLQLIYRLFVKHHDSVEYM